MAVAFVNISIEKGTDFRATFNISGPDNGPVSLDDYTPVAKIRKHPTSVKVSSFTATLVADVGDTSVTIQMNKTLTAQLSSGRNYFDVFLVDDNTGYTIKVVEGSAIVSDSVSL